MLIVILEAVAAFFIFVFIVWWTMFSGPKTGYHEQARERQAKDDAAD
ncbi:hypothetical protein [Rugamonas sp.]|nr:hypothetical protein [Rugamonas sp.]